MGLMDSFPHYSAFMLLNSIFFFFFLNFTLKQEFFSLSTIDLSGWKLSFGGRGASLCFTGYVPALPASVHRMSVAGPSCDGHSELPHVPRQKE